MRLKNKVAIVTGGGTGIGKAIALGYAREGAKVVIAARNLSRLEKTAKEIEALGAKALPVKTDVTKMDEVDSMVKQAMASFGKIDILVNNAAIYPGAPFLEMGEEEMDEVFAVDIKGQFFCTQAVVKKMIEQKSGRIIIINSAQSRIGNVTIQTHYAAAKGALLAATRCWAYEFGPLGITVNGIACGLTYTDTLLGLVSKEYCENWAKTLPLRRNGVPEDYVGIAVFLASDESSYITGQTISVDGGNVMP